MIPKRVVPTVMVALSITLSASAQQHQDAFTKGQDSSPIAQRVRQALLFLPGYGVFDDLGFQVDGSAVTLIGDVIHSKLKNDAEAAVKQIEGVSRVVNQINVLPSSTVDDQIRAEVYRAIYQDIHFAVAYGQRSIQPIHIIVKNKDVRLEGDVDNQVDKDLAAVRANTRDAYKVINDLQIRK